jgi:hypothetical protein
MRIGKKNSWKGNVDTIAKICTIVPHPDIGVAGASDLLIGFSTHDLAKLVLNEVVERLDVLLGQASSLPRTTKPHSFQPGKSL